MKGRTFTLGAGSGVVKYSGTGETAKITEAKAKDAIAAAVTGVASSADTINNVKAGDKITLATNSTNITELVALSSGAVSSISGNLNADSKKGDVFVLKNGTDDYFLVYEADGSGTAGSLGSNAEVIKLVGFTDDNTITVMDNKTIVIG